jgi:uncharacterized protein YciI
MKRILSFITLFTLIFTCMAFCQETKKEPKPEEQIKQYWFVMLTKGANRTQDSVTAARIQEGHMANIHRLYNEGQLKVAGPFGDGDWLGIFIFDASVEGCKTKDEMKKLLTTDPAIAAGRLNYELHSWWTSPEGSFKPGKPQKN